MENRPRLDELIQARHALAVKEQRLFLRTVEKINMSMNDLLKNDFGTTLVKNISWDLAGEIVRRYFDFGDCYISVEQMAERLFHFSYDSDKDILMSDSGIRTTIYNYSDSRKSSTMKSIILDCDNAQRQLFTENRAQDNLDIKGKKAYRTIKTTDNGKLYDELTGREGSSKTIIKNSKEVQVSDLQADHIQARESIMYNERNIRADKVEQLKKFYNSSDNMQMIHASANSSKGDVRVCENNKGQVEYLNAKEMRSRQDKGEKLKDISYKATAEQLVEATISQWEKETKSGNKMETLKEKGYLDENGKVKPEVKKELVNNFRHSQNRESIEILKDTDYQTVSKVAASKTKASMKKILAGQVIYYVMPPLVFETKNILRKRGNIKIDDFLEELKKSRKRVIKYVKSKMVIILKNIAGNTLHKFIKTFFDIIIEMIKATVKRLIKLIKDVVLVLVNCLKILADKSSSPAQKADSITKILSATVTAIVMELFFEFLEKQFGLPDFLMEPLQIIVTILSTNIIMLILNKADLFDTQYGLLVANIEKLFDEEKKKYMSASKELLELGVQDYEKGIETIQLQIKDLTQSIGRLNIYKDDAQSYLEEISDIFNIGIDFNVEWQNFIG